MHHSNGLLGRGRFGCTGAVRGGRPSPEPSFTSLQQTLTARPRSVHQAREQSLSVGECDRGVDITPLTVWPLTFMLALKAVPHGCRHLLFTCMCSTIPTSPDSGLTSRCSWTAQANPPSHPLCGCVQAMCGYTCGWAAKTDPSPPSLYGVPILLLSSSPRPENRVVIRHALI